MIRSVALSILAALMAVLTPPSSMAQAPHENWMTLRTPHYRVHFPEEYQEWARYAASRLESIHARVGVEVGYVPPEVVDVLIMDPVAQANGSAWPSLGWPRMVLWTNPPDPQSALGNYVDWQELLIAHEQVHLSHLLRPSRNARQRLLSTLIPISTMRRSPRWVSEGYATLLEGSLTRSGRPHGALRQAVLRRWAQLGRLPSYSRLQSDSRSYLGMSMAYLVGSSYLEWLQERSGPDSLRKLWARMTARKDRSFEEAFRGVFGEKPAALYGRYTAELTSDAIAVEKRTSSVMREGELWQDLEWSTEAPAVSPDGKFLVTVLRGRDVPSRLSILSTEPDVEGEEKWREKIADILRRDPEDFAPVTTRPLPRKPKYKLLPTDAADFHSPRWMPDGKSILVVRFMPDSDGFLHPDLFRWWFLDGRLERLTRAADLRDPDPAAEGGWAVAVRNRHGRSQLVRVELASGSIEEITPAAVDVVYDHPRLDKSASRIVYIRHREGQWALVLRDLRSGQERIVHSFPGRVISQPQWKDEQTVIATVSVGDEGTVELYEIPLGEGNPRQLTRSPGASLAAGPVPDGSAVFFLGLDADGLELRRLTLGGEALPDVARDVVGVPIGVTSPLLRGPRPSQPVERFSVVDVPPAVPYGAGKQERFYLLGGNAAPSTNTLEAGVRLGDLVGRFDTLLAGAVGERGGPEGFSLSSVFRGLPVELGGHLFTFEERPSRQPERVAGLGTLLDAKRTGLELTAARRFIGSISTVWLSTGGLFSEREPEAGERYDQNRLFVDGRWTLSPRLGVWRTNAGLRGSYHRDLDQSQNWTRTSATAGAGTKAFGFSFSFDHDRASASMRADEQLALGGLPSTLVPRSADINRLQVPALPVGTLIGEQHDGFRASVRGSLPVEFFYESHKMSSGLRSGEVSLAGLEVRLTSLPMPLLRFPGFDFTLGAARILDDPLKDETTWWTGVAWRP